MEGKPFSRSAAMTARQVSQGSVIVCIRFLVIALSQKLPRPPCCIASLKKRLADYLRELVRASQALLSVGNHRGEAVTRGWSHHRDTSNALFGPIRNSRPEGLAFLIATLRPATAARRCSLRSD